MPYTSLHKLLVPLGYEESEIDDVLDGLIDRGYLKMPSSGLIFPSGEKESLFERGRVHTNIEDKPSFKVFEVDSGKYLGDIEILNPSFVLRGKVWGVVAVKRRSIYVKQLKSLPSKVEKVFKGKGSSLWDWRVGMQVKKRLYPQLAESDVPFFVDGDLICIVHFLGPLIGYVWAETLQRRCSIDARDVGGVMITIQGGRCPEDFLQIDTNSMGKTLIETASNITKFLTLGSFFSYLTGKVRQRAIFEAFGLEEVCSMIRGLKLAKINTCDGIKMFDYF
jgi:hypothetical protein